MKGHPIILTPAREVGVFVFRLPFPAEIETEDVTNYELIDVIGGVKPIFYANIEPQKIELREMLFDATDNPKGSVREQLERLRELMKRYRGSDQASGIKYDVEPLLFRFICGPTKKNVYIERLTIKESSFTQENVLQRATVSMTLIEKPVRELVTVSFPDLDE